MNLKIAAFLAGAAFCVGMPAAASTETRTYDIAFIQDGVGDAGADWFGSLTIECDGSVRTCDGSVRTFTAMIDGVTYDTASTGFGPITLVDDPTLWPVSIVEGLSFAGPPVDGTSPTSLYFYNFGIDSGGSVTYSNTWDIATCSIAGDLSFCSSARTLGTYTVTLAAVPLPASLPLAATGIASFLALRRRRKAA